MLQTSATANENDGDNLAEDTNASSQYERGSLNFSFISNLNTLQTSQLLVAVVRDTVALCTSPSGMQILCNRLWQGPLRTAVRCQAGKGPKGFGVPREPPKSEAAETKEEPGVVNFSTPSPRDMVSEYTACLGHSSRSRH